MEGLIILGLIIYGIYSLMGESCEHEWSFGWDSRKESCGWGCERYIAQHKCLKCGKKEDCDHDTFSDCSKCGSSFNWNDND